VIQGSKNPNHLGYEQQIAMKILHHIAIENGSQTLKLFMFDLILELHLALLSKLIQF
jgi:hypothetical protein